MRAFAGVLIRNKKRPEVCIGAYFRPFGRTRNLRTGPLGRADRRDEHALVEALVDDGISHAGRVDDCGRVTGHLPQRLFEVATQSHARVVVDAVTLDHCFLRRSAEPEHPAVTQDDVVARFRLLESERSPLFHCRSG